MKLNEIIRREGSSSPYEKGYEDMHPDAAKEMVKKTEALIKKLTDGQGWTGGPSGTDAYNRDWKKNIAKEKKRLMMFKKLAARKVTEDMMGGPFVNFLFGLSGAIDNLKWWFDKGEGPAWWTSEYKKNQDYDMKTWRQGPYEKGPKPGGIKNPKWAIIWWMAFYIQNEADGKETPANIAKAARNVFKFLGNKIHYTKDKDEVIKAMIDLYNEKKEFAPHMEVPERDKKKKWYNKLGESSDKDYNDLIKLIKRMVCSDLMCSPSQEEHAVTMLYRSSHGSKSKAMNLIKSMVRKEHPKSHLFQMDEFETAFDNALADMTGGTEFEWTEE